MTGVKFQKFLGKAPKIAAELLPDTAGQIATNCKLYSGDLIPFPEPVVVSNHGLTGVTPQTLHGLRNPSTGNPTWLVWDTDVDIATPSGADDPDEQRFYYTGDGVPKVSNYALATSGSAPYPVDYYELGLPLPTQTPNASAASFTTKTTVSYARDAAGVVTLVTSTAHGLKNGAFVTVNGFTSVSGTYSQSGANITVTINNHGLSTGSQILLRFTSGDAADNVFTVDSVTNANTFVVVSTTSLTTSGNVDWDIGNLNGTSVEVTVVNDTTFTYSSPGFQVSTTSSTDGRIDLGGNTQARTYLYTWYTPWEEESIGSEPSEALFIKEGQIVTVSNLPTAAPSGKNFIRGIRLYRTLSSARDTEYLRLATLWFPISISRVQRTSNVSRVTTSQPHNLSVGGYFKIGSASVSSFNITGGEVTDVINEYTFEYDQTAANVADTAATGTVYHDVSENPGTTTARYWGDGSYNFTDDFAVASLLNALVTDDYDPPPDGLKGLVVYNNNILAGFVNNELYFSVPGQYHAWPVVYKRSIESTIIGLAVFSGYLLVLTENYPYLVSGNDPSVFSLTRVDARYPCLNKKSIANMGFGVMYSTHDGLAIYSTTTGPQLVTRLLYNSDTWNEALDPTTLIGTSYKDSYLAWHSAGGLVFERDEQVGGFFVDLDNAVVPTSTWYDPLTNALYFTYGTTGDVYQWDDLTQPSQTYEWKSKVIQTENPINIGVARVLADYSQFSTTWDAAATAWDATASTWDVNDEVTFKLWVDKTLVQTVQLNSSNMFRLPSGYLSDTFEVGVSGSVRIRSIRLAETPTDLRNV